MDNRVERPDEGLGARVGALLEECAQDVIPPAELVRGGLAQGRRMRVRRRVTRTVTALVVAGGVTTGALAVGGSPGRAPAEAARGVVVPDFSSVAASSAAADRTPVTGATVLRTLEALLPGDPAVSGRQKWDGDAPGSGAGARLLADGAEVQADVQGDFQFAMRRHPSKEAPPGARADTPGGKEAAPGGREAAPGGREAAPGDKEAARRKAGPAEAPEVDEEALRDFYSCAGRRTAGVRQASCSARNLDDGSMLITYEEREGELVRRIADVLRGDGTRVVITAVNGADGKYGPALFATPPYTQTQLAALAAAPGWRAWA
ncbi:hypothetical protein ABT026_15585 [Streptomyces sp. NPDC002734]|uniref:hypothetical protein n=1 Tax=Streptomyces sp. NPDC002734 TaxID=3154426 RepID=UPI00333173DB